MMPLAAPQPQSLLQPNPQGQWALLRHQAPRSVEAMATADGVGGVLDMLVDVHQGSIKLNLHYRCGPGGSAVGLAQLVLTPQRDSCAVAMAMGPRPMTLLLTRVAEAMVRSPPQALCAPAPTGLKSACSSFWTLCKILRARFGPIVWLPHDGRASTRSELVLRLDEHGRWMPEAVALSQLLRGLPLRFGWSRLAVRLCRLPGMRQGEEVADELHLVDRAWTEIIKGTGAGAGGQCRLTLENVAPSAWRITRLVALSITRGTAQRNWTLEVHGEVFAESQDLPMYPPSLAESLSHAGEGPDLWGAVSKLRLVVDAGRACWASARRQAELAAQLRVMPPGAIPLSLVLVLHPRAPLPEVDGALLCALAEHRYVVKVQVRSDAVWRPDPARSPPDVTALAELAQDTVGSLPAHLELVSRTWAARAAGTTVCQLWGPHGPEGETPQGCGLLPPSELWAWRSSDQDPPRCLTVVGDLARPQTLAVCVKHTLCPHAAAPQRT